jgi:hypothetical protein
VRNHASPLLSPHSMRRTRKGKYKAVRKPRVLIEPGVGEHGGLIHSAHRWSGVLKMPTERHDDPSSVPAPCLTCYLSPLL